MAETPNTELVRRFYREAINERRLDAVGELLTADFVHNGDSRGSAGQTEAVRMFLDAFADLHNEIDILFGEDDLVCARQTWTGTHTGEFAGVAPSGHRVTVTSTAILRIDDGRIAEAWDEGDFLGAVTRAAQDA